MLCLVAHSCLTLFDPIDCSQPGSSVPGDSPGQNTGMIAMPSSRASSQPRDITQVSHITGGFFTVWVNREAILRDGFVKNLEFWYWWLSIGPLFAFGHLECKQVEFQRLKLLHRIGAQFVCFSAKSQIAEKIREAKGKGKKERYTHLNAEFQRIARRDKKAFLSDQCKKNEEDNRMGKIRGLFKKIRDTKGTFHAKIGTIKDRNGMDLTKEKVLRRRGKNTQKNYTKQIFMTQRTMMVWSLT